MDFELNSMQDVSRLCKSLGIDPSSYVRFDTPLYALNRSKNQNTSTVQSEVGGSSQRSSAQGKASQHPNPSEASSTPVRFEDIPVQWRPGAVTRTSSATAQVAMLSLRTGTGKTTLAGIVARLLKTRRHSVLLADYSKEGGFHTFFGLENIGHGPIAFVGGSLMETPIALLSHYRADGAFEEFESWLELLSARTTFTFIDGVNDAASDCRELLDRGVRAIVPVLPDMLTAMRAVILDNALQGSRVGNVDFVLNRFVESNPVHRQVKAWLREYLGERLLPFEIQEEPSLGPLATGDPHGGEHVWSSNFRRSVELLATWLETAISDAGVEPREVA